MKKAFLAFIFVGFAGVCHAQNWEYKEIKDEMRGSSTYIASLKSENENQYSPPYDGGASLEILLFSKDGKISDKVGLVLTRGQLSCPRNDVCDVQAKFGDGQVEEMTTKVVGDSNDTLVVFYAPEFVETLRLSERLIIEVPVYKEGRSQFKFLPKDISWKGVEDGKQFLSMFGRLNLRERQGKQEHDEINDKKLLCNKEGDFKIFSNISGEANICTIDGMVAKVDVSFPYDKETFKKIISGINKSLNSKITSYDGDAMWLSEETGGVASIFLSAKKKEGVKLGFMYNPVFSINSPMDKDR